MIKADKLRLSKIEVKRGCASCVRVYYVRGLALFFLVIFFLVSPFGIPPSYRDLVEGHEAVVF